MSSRDSKKKNTKPNIADIPSHEDKPRTVLNVTNHVDPSTKSRSPVTYPSVTNDNFKRK